MAKWLLFYVENGFLKSKITILPLIFPFLFFSFSPGGRTLSFSVVSSLSPAGHGGASAVSSVCGARRRGTSGDASVRGARGALAMSYACRAAPGSWMQRRSRPHPPGGKAEVSGFFPAEVGGKSGPLDMEPRGASFCWLLLSFESRKGLQQRLHT